MDQAKRPPLRQQNQPDEEDGNRIQYAMEKWKVQDIPLLPRDRMVEECMRFLVGQQNIAWSDMLQRYVDVNDLLGEEERRWRQKPVFNRLLAWFLLNHSRMTENPPIVTFLPGPDRKDAILAETMDAVFKALWREVGMDEIQDRLMAWLLVGGSGYTNSRIDLNRGAIRKSTGPAKVPVLDMRSGQPQKVGEEEIPDAPLTKEGGPAVGIDAATGQHVPIGEQHGEPEGALVVDVFGPLEVRSEWGPEPFHLKKWHLTKSYLPPEEIFDRWGVKLRASGTTSSDSTHLTRVMFGGGWWGASSNMPGSNTTNRPSQELIEVFTLWEAPCRYPGMEQTVSSHGGRLLVVTPTDVLFDGTRPLPFKYTSPLKRFDFARIPGRPQGTSPLEIQLMPQRSYNKGWEQILTHRSLVTNPKMIVDQGSGLANTVITNKPGEKIVVNRRQNVPPFEWASPPSLGGDVYQIQEMLLRELEEFGNMRGSGGESPTPEASGELVKELRFNSDRFLGPTMKRAVQEFARMVEDWITILPVLWDQQKVIRYAGDDNVAHTVTVLPDMFLGTFVDVVPDIESMLPEGRGERQQKIYALWKDGIWGPPGTPEANKVVLEQMRFPNMGRSAKVGGVHRVMADQFLGRMVQGEPAQNLPWFPWYNPMVHLDVMENFMAAPEYLQLPIPVQEQLGERWEMIKQLVDEIMAAQEAKVMEQEEASEGGNEPPQEQTA